MKGVKKKKKGFSFISKNMLYLSLSQEKNVKM